MGALWQQKMVFEELPIVATETTVAKRMIRTDALARTVQKTAAKKKAARKSAKKPKAKKAKKAKKPKAKKKKKKKKKKAKKKKKRRKKKKAKKLRYPGGHRVPHAAKSKKKSAASKKNALALKKKGGGLFKTKTLSSDLAAITGKNKMNYPEAFKAVWAFIKKN